MARFVPCCQQGTIAYRPLTPRNIRGDMSNLSVFDFQNQGIRFADGKPVAIDVAKALGYADPKSAVKTLVSPENKGVGKIPTIRYGEKVPRMQEVMLLEEAGIYQLIFGSKLQGAKQFQKWVFEEVLPQIRKTGGYGKAREGFEWFERVKLYRRHTKIPTGWFSIFEEMCSHLMADFEDAGYSLPLGSVPDISVGKYFCQYLRDQGYDTADQAWVRKYQHRYPDGRIVDANIYCIELLAMYRIWFEQTYTQIHLVKYLKSKDRLALPSLCKMLGLPEGSH